jgi:tetratricopeptide (TPR) repeat protein
MDNATRAIRFKMLTPDDQISNYAGRGFRWGMQWPNTTAFQKSVWEEDRFEILVNEFEAMVSVIEGSEPGEEHPLPNILQTISLFIAGDNFASAEALIRPLIAQEPDNPELIFLLAKAVHGRCRYDEAIFLFQKLDLLIGNNPDVLAGLGKSLLKNNQTKDAIEILQHAIDAGTQDPYAMIDLADAYLTLSMMDEAFHSLKRTSALLGAEDQSRASWQTGKRMIALMSNAGEIEKAKILILNMRGRFGHYTEISSALDAFEKLIRSG